MKAKDIGRPPMDTHGHPNSSSVTTKKVERNGMIRLSMCQVHNRRLCEFRIKLSNSKAHRKGREDVIFVVSRPKWMSAVVGAVDNKAEEQSL
jgi:hypothetical protein